MNNFKKLSRAEMKNVRGGEEGGSNCGDSCLKNSDCNGGTANTCNTCSGATQILPWTCVTSVS
jgi:hypothetical protein